jgi:hypothetical protein
MVGAAGFEPTTPCPPDKCATRLRYAPMYHAAGPGEEGGDYTVPPPAVQFA